jgi:hypothetical protein
VKKILICSLLFLSSNLLSEEMMTPLSSYIKKNPKFRTDPVAAIFITSRCSAVFSKVAIRLNSDNRSEKQQLGKEFEDYSTIYDGASMYLHKKIGMSQKVFLARYKIHLDQYDKQMMQNYNLDGEMFGGWVGEDLDICTSNYNYFLEFVKSQHSKESKV